jgi:hypothetical protein
MVLPFAPAGLPVCFFFFTGRVFARVAMDVRQPFSVVPRLHKNVG